MGATALQHSQEPSLVADSDCGAAASSSLLRLEQQHPGGLCRPKLLLDAAFIPVSGGVEIRFRGRRFTIQGSGNYDLLSALVPYLTGEFTAHEIFLRANVSNHAAAQHILDSLLKEGAAIDRPEVLSALDSSVHAYFQNQIEFIEHYARDPVQRFERFRCSRVFLAGAGLSLRALTASLARNGLAQVTVSSDAEDFFLDEELTVLLEEHRAAAVPFSLQRGTLSENPEDLVKPFDIVCYLADRVDLRTALQLSEFCRHRAMPFVPGSLIGESGFVGPTPNVVEDACFLCLLMRLSDNGTADLSARIWKQLALADSSQLADRMPSVVMLRLMANVLGFEVFKLLTGHLPAESQDAVLSIHSETLETATRPILAYPSCPHCAISKAKTKDPASSPKVRANSKLAKLAELDRISHLEGELVGTLGMYRDFTAKQSPLFHSEMLLPWDRLQDRRNAVGNSIESNGSARIQAALRAVSSYCLRFGDSCHIWKGSLGSARESNLPTVDAQLITGWMGSLAGEPQEASRSWIRVRSLKNGKEHLVPKLAVYRDRRLSGSQFDDSEAGTSAAFTMQEACDEALLSVMAYEVLKAVATGDLAMRAIDTSALEQTPDLVYLEKCFASLQHSFELAVYENASGLVAALASDQLDGQKVDRVAVGAGASLTQAVTRALTEYLAIAVGNPAGRTAAYYLPKYLGSHLHPFSRRSAGRKADSDLFYLPPDDALIADLSTPDISSAGIIVVRALFVRRSQTNQSNVDLDSTVAN